MKMVHPHPQKMTGVLIIITICWLDYSPSSLPRYISTKIWSFGSWIDADCNVVSIYLFRASNSCLWAGCELTVGGGGSPWRGLPPPPSSPVHSIVTPQPRPQPLSSCCVADPPSSFFTIRTLPMGMYGQRIRINKLLFRYIATFLYTTERFKPNPQI